MTSVFTKSLSSSSASDVAIAGSKGASLGEMTNAGIPVPNGFIVLVAAFEHFLNANGLIAEVVSIMHSAKANEIHTIENALEKIQALILNSAVPEEISAEILKGFKRLNSKFVAVRSSATAEDSNSAAWAGQLESYLNTTEENLLDNVKKCWSSLFTPRAIFYRFEKKLHSQSISVAIVVQKMIQSEKSGVAFSVHSVTQDKNQLIIEAGFGLGEAIVSGQITPDSYVVEKGSLNIIEKTVHIQERGLFRKESGGNEWRNISKKQGEKQVLTDAEIIELSKLIIKIESHYGFPCDIEFAQENGKFYIVQSRPTTTLAPFQSQSIPRNNVQVVLLAKKWKRYLTRPFTLFGASLWRMWHDCDAFEECFETRVKDSLMVEERPHTVAFYIHEETLAQLTKHMDAFAQDKRNVVQALQKGLRLVDRANAILNGKEKCKSFEEEVEFISRLVMYSGRAPRVALKNKSLSKKFWSTAEQLRRRSHYFKFLERILIPLAQKTFSLPKKEIENRTISQLLEGTKRVPKSGKFIYSMLDGAESVMWRTSKGVDRIIKMLEPELREEVTRLKGISAFPGKIRGIVRAVDSFNYSEAKFNKGDVLVSINSSSLYIHLIKKASALVADEGGMGCHAAIIAREFKKPCIIGTKIATRVLREGDMVEVDANLGIVRVLKHAKFG